MSKESDERGVSDSTADWSICAERSTTSNQSNYLATILSITTDAFVVVDDQELICFLNPAAADLFGYNREEILLAPLEKLIPARFRERHGEHIKRFKSDPERTRMIGERSRIVGLRKNGEEFPAEATITKVTTSAGMQFAILLRDITERAALEESWRQQALRSYATFDQAFHLVLMLDTDGHIVEVNRAALAGLGLPKERVLGRRLWEICGDDRLSAVPKHLRDVFLAAISTGVAQSLTLEIGTSARRLFDLSIAPIKDGKGEIVFLAAEGHDITERFIAEQQLRVSHAYLAASQRIARLGHWILDLRTGKMEWSEEVFRILGFECRETLPSLEDLFSAIHSIDRLEFERAVRDAASGEPFAFDHQVILPDGKARTVFQQAELVNDTDGRPAKLTGIIQDITERKETEDQLIAAKLAAESASQAKSTFLAQMSHELRTPLNAIIGFAELIKRQIKGPIGNESYCDYADHIYQSGSQLLGFIEHILDFARIGTGQIAIKEQSVSLSDIARKTLAMFEAESAQAQISLELDAPDDSLVLADGILITQVLINLLSNALKATAPHGQVRVMLRKDSDTGSVILSVVDNGIGIAPDSLESILEPFGALSSAGITINRGAGLGIPFSKAVAELHNGRLEIQSVVGEGTTVRLILPPERLLEDASETVPDPARLDAQARAPLRIVVQ